MSRTDQPFSGWQEPASVRNPTEASGEQMTTRGWWLVVLNVLIPGSAQVVAGNRRLGRIGLFSTFVLWVAALLLAASGPPVVGHGLEFVQPALDLQRGGVSVQKVIMTL